MRFRPCIDLHAGKVKQIVGSTLSGDDREPVTNFTASQAAAYYARLYREDGLYGGHVIMLGPGNEEAALSALAAYPGGLQVGGGITPINAARFLEQGASHVIVTSYVFHAGQVDLERLEAMVAAVGAERLVLDLSCRRYADGYYIMTDRWQKRTQARLQAPTLTELARYCAEFLVHAVDVEGKRAGIDAELVSLLRKAPLPVTYAGGVRHLADLELVRQAGAGCVDATAGSALDIFGGDLAYREVVRWQQSLLGTPLR